MNNRPGINQYQRVDVESRVAVGNPHTMISMLLDGALKRIAIAHGATKRGDIATKGNTLSGAIRILDSLRAALDHKRGGQIADNLEALYSYMERRLMEANRNSDTDILDEVSMLLGDIKEAWDGMPAQHRNMEYRNQEYRGN
jgi:flagellar secretion chaperone FliS